MTRPSWVALHGLTQSFSELDQAVAHVVRLVSFLWLWFSVSLPANGKGKRGGKNTQNYTKKYLHDPDNHDGVITHVEPYILECEV